MLRLINIVAVTLLVSIAAAGPLPENARVALVGQGGVVVGVGEFRDGSLNLTLDTAASGFVTLLIENEDGTIVSIDGMISADGRVLVVVDGAMEDVFASVEAKGGAVLVAFEDRIARGVENVASLPEGAQAGMEKAADNHAAARERASASGEAEADTPTDADAPAAEAGAEVTADVEVDVDTPVGEVGAGVSVGVGVGVGGGAGGN